jgi:hypothetical protein
MTILNKLALRCRGLLVLVLWQAVPVGTDEYGRTRLGIGLGAGRIEFSTLTCEGDVIESDTHGYQTAGATLEHWLSARRVLLRASGAYSWSDSTSLHGPYGAVTLSREWQRFGIGGGIAFVPDTDFEGAEEVRSAGARPSAYVRAGNRDKLHVRMELFAPSLVTHVVPWSLVVGYNQFARGRPSGSLGMALIGTEDPTGGGVAQGFLPIGRNAELGLTGFLSPGRENVQVGLGAQLRFTLP